MLVATLVAPPAVAAAPKPLGVVLQTQHAALRSTQVTPGTTVFYGDTASTERGGLLRIQTAFGQIEVQGDSAAVFEESESGPIASLARGTAAFASPDGAIGVRASGMLVRPQNRQAAHGQVTVLSPTEIIVTSYRGPLQVSYMDEMLVVPENTSYRVTQVKGDVHGPGPVGAGAESARREKLRAFLIVFVVAIAPLTAAIVHDVLASPSSIF